MLICVIQVLFTCKARRRGRGDYGVISNSDNHIKFGNRGNFVDALFQNLPGKQSKHKDKQLAVATILEKYKPVLLGVAEPTSEDMEKIRVAGYSLIKGNLKRGRKVRLNVLIKDGVQYKIEKFCSEVPSSLITVDKFKFLFYYREWRKEGRKNTDVMEEQQMRWADFLAKVAAIKGRLVLMGDTNICDMNEQTAHQKSLAGLRDMMREQLVGEGYTQMIKDTTRHLDGQVSACLDHVFTRESKYVVRTYNQNLTGFDHNMVGCRVRTDKPVFIPKTLTIRDDETVDPMVFHQIWHHYNPWEIMAEKDPERAAEIFNFKLNMVMDTVAPTKVFQARENYAPWVTPEMRERMNKRDEMHQAAVRTGNWAEYKVVKNKVRNDLKKDEYDWKTKYMDFSEAGDKEGWRRLKVMAGAENKSANIVLEIDGKEVDDPKVLAQKFNDFFVDKVDGIVKQCPPDPPKVIEYMVDFLKDKDIGRFDFYTVGDGEVRKAIMKLNSSKATGLDGVKVGWLKRFCHTVTPFLRHVVNRIIVTGKYPDQFKSGCISPLPKKGCLREIKNWRPVVLLSTCSRVVEKILNKQMKAYLEAYKLLPRTQHAYRKGYSTISAWSDLDLFVSRARDEGRHVSMTCEDMSSAFNTVDYSVIHPKLRLMGFGDQSLSLIKSYMHGRTNRTRVDNHVTGPRHVSTGIGEGSVLGPLVFLVTVMNVEVVLERTRARVKKMFPDLEDDQIRLYLVAYADDISGLIDCTCPNVLRAAMTILSDEFKEFFSAQGLKVNGEKEEHITWAKKSTQRAEVTLSGRDSAETVKLLGITVDNTYSFMPHCVSVTRRMMTRVSYLYRIRDFVSKVILRRVARALILTIYEYALEIHGRAPAVQKYLQKTVNTVLRVVTWGKRDTRVSRMLAEAGYLNVTNQHRYNCVMSIERLINTRASQLEFDILKRGQEHQYSTRVNSLLAEWRPKCMVGYNSHLLVSLTIFNSMKINQMTFESTKELKESLSSIILDHHVNGNV